MDILEIAINEDIVDAVRKIRSCSSLEVTLNIAKNSVLFENSLNLKIIKKEAEKSGKTVEFETEDEIGKNLIEMLDPEEGAKLDQETGFISSSENIESKIPLKPKFKLPNLGISKLNFRVGYIFIGIFLLALLFYYLFFLLPKADVSLVVNSQPLVKSVTVKLSSQAMTYDTKQRLLPGRTLEATTSATSIIDTTGEKLVGQTAKGEITVYNKTDEDKKFKKGAVISQITNKTSLKFTLDEDVTVPKKTVTQPADPLLAPITEYGKKKVPVTAQDIGSKYNLGDGENFKIDNNDVDSFIAENENDFKGGSSKTVKAVAKEDKDKLSLQVLESGKVAALSLLKSKLKGDQKLVESTVVYSKLSETFDKNVGDESDKLSVTGQVQALGLYYSGKELSALLDELLTEFVPKDYEISKKDSNIDVEVLNVPVGAVILEVSLQVKIKAYIVPVINESEVARNLKGKKISQARSYLSGIKNIKSYELGLWPKFTTILGIMPSRTDRIQVKVQRE